MGTLVAELIRDPDLGRGVSLPGFVNVHSHAFQFGLRGQTQRSPITTGTFWSWRDAMYAMAESLTPERIYVISRAAFEALARSGVVAVGEFHYVHHQADGTPYDDRTVMSEAVVRAALDADLSVCLLRVAYQRAGAGRGPEGAQRTFSDRRIEDVFADIETLSRRFRDEPRVAVGLAPHSVRAVSREWLAEIATWVRAHPMPLHMHVAEQIGEVEACLAEHRRRPVELAADVGLLVPHFCAVHATRVEPHEAKLLGDAHALACICPTTERDLGDGLADLAALRTAGVSLCVGIDSHVVTDQLEEIRALETHERLRLRKRVTHVPVGRTLAEQLIVEGSLHGARALGLCDDALTFSPRTRVWATETSGLAHVADEGLVDAVVFSGSGLLCERVGEARWAAK